jgi:type VI secretion system protein ImpE
VSRSDAAEQCLKNGDPVEALARLQEEVRAKPADAKLRVFLFQLLCVLGQWERALNQLKVASGLDPMALAMAQMYGEAVRCELVRHEVFTGKKSPMVLGEPEQWLALLIESLLLAGRGQSSQSEQFRVRAFEEAETVSGALDDHPFTWIADADSRLGPVLEAIINGRYYWVPFSRLSKVSLDPPADLRDMVWMPAHLSFENGGESVALVPTRYPGSEDAADGLIVLGRKTLWEELAEGAHRGLGQRVLTTDDNEKSILEIRTIVIDRQATTEAASATADHG